MKNRIHFICFLLLLLASSLFAVIKQRYGGNLKVAEDLIPALRAVQLFRTSSNGPVAMFPILYQLEERSAKLDFSFLPPDQITQLEKSVEALKEVSHPCHWILDYPYLGHQHLNSISVEEGQIVIRSNEPDFLNTILLSSCLSPRDFQRLQSFRVTQFGFEANPTCLAGRPFLDSITPVSVDPLNPYLSFKLNEVDVFPVPEEKFQQIKTDPQLSIVSGPEIFLFLSASNLTPEQTAFVRANIDTDELARSVINNHAEILTSNTVDAPVSNPFQQSLYLILPQENPYRLLAERLKLQLEDARLTIVNGPPPPQNRGAKVLSLLVRQIQEDNFDLFRYRLLLENFKSTSPWFEIWDDLESSGKILPLMIHQSKLAVRKGVLDVQTQKNGMPDFSNSWIQEAP